MLHPSAHRTATAGVGLSSNADTRAAVEEALQEALSAGDMPPQLVILYATVTHDQAEILHMLRERLPGVPIAGASSPGASVTGRATEAPRCLGLTVLRSDTVTARAEYVEGLAADPWQRGRDLAQKLGPPGDRSVTFVWYDPLTGANVAALLSGLAEGGYPAVFGGGAGQPYGPRVRTFQYCGDRVMSDSAVAIRIDGLSAIYEMTHGMDPTGIELTVTRAKDNVIEELDGEPALDVCCEQLGFEGISTQSSNWALGFKPPSGTEYEGLFTRGIFGVDPDKKTITLQAPIAVGTTAQLCIKTKEAVLDRTLEMARRLRERITTSRPVLILGFECAARPPFVGLKAAAQEVLDVQAILGPEIPWLGMLAWGELAPLSGRTEFHNYTFPICVLCE